MDIIKQTKLRDYQKFESMIKEFKAKIDGYADKFNQGTLSEVVTEIVSDLNSFSDELRTKINQGSYDFNLYKEFADVHGLTSVEQVAENWDGQ